MWQVLGVSLEVDNNLFGLADVQQEIVVSAPHGEKIDLFPVVSLIVVSSTNFTRWFVVVLQSCVSRGKSRVLSTQGGNASTSEMLQC